MRRVTVHSPGRTGSSSIAIALHASSLPNMQILHTHALCMNTLTWIVDNAESLRLLERPDIGDSIHWLNPPPTLADELTIVPIRPRYLRNTSDFLLQKFGHPAAWDDSYARQAASLVDEFMAEYPHRYVDQWANQEFAGLFGLDLQSPIRLGPGCVEFESFRGPVITLTVPSGLDSLRARLGGWLGRRLAPFGVEMASRPAVISAFRSAIPMDSYSQRINAMPSEWDLTWEDVLEVIAPRI